MKTIITLAVFSLVQYAQASQYPVDIVIDADRSAYEAMEQSSQSYELPIPYQSFNTVIELGLRNLEWLDHLNSFRENPIPLTSKETQVGYPIETPSVYGPSTIFPKHDSILQGLPKQMHNILISNEEFVDQLPVSEETYLLWARQINRNYQSAVRWRTLSSWKHWYKRNRINDIRGVYFLINNPNHLNEIKRFNELPLEQQQHLSEHLEGICVSDNYSWADCPYEFQQAKNQNRLVEFYHEHFERAKDKYNYYFRLDVRRGDVSWPNKARSVVAFRDPRSAEVRHFLKHNIEEEWSLNEWGLKLEFRSNANIHIVFRPNVVPNVNGLGGNRITMNSADSLTDYNTQWTIRHEFGHVLGFPDCYVEYFDEDENVFVNYQIDTTNLMCSRRGILQKKHLSELKRVYNQTSTKD